MLNPNRVPTYTCRHHTWDHWRQFGVSMWSSGCIRSEKMSACLYCDAAQCPHYERLSDEALQAIQQDKAVKGGKSNK